jgi:hypothetical protein
MYLCLFCPGNLYPELPPGTAPHSSPSMVTIFNLQLDFNLVEDSSFVASHRPELFAGVWVEAATAWVLLLSADS